MLLLTLHEPLNRPNLTLEPGRYILESINAGEILATGVSCETEAWSPESHQGWVGQGVMVICAGGYGDLLFLTPILKQMCRHGKITVSCWPRFAEALAGLDGIDIVPYPLAFDNGVALIQRIYTTERAMEKHRDLHAVDAMAKAIGVELPEDQESLRLPRLTIRSPQSLLRTPANRWRTKARGPGVGIGPLPYLSRKRASPGTRGTHGARLGALLLRWT
jgi:hypothetical protein